MSVVEKPMRTRRVWRRLVPAAVLLLMAGGLLKSWLAPEVPVPVGLPVRYDDFSFSVVGSWVETLGAGSDATPYRIVRLRVENGAKRVAYQFRRKTAVMVFDGGREAGISPRGQAALDRARATPDPLSGPLPAGAEGTTELAFELPPSATNPRLKISHGGPAFDVLDDLIVGKKRLAIDR